MDPFLKLRYRAKRPIIWKGMTRASFWLFMSRVSDHFFFEIFGTRSTKYRSFWTNRWFWRSLQTSGEKLLMHDCKGGSCGSEFGFRPFEKSGPWGARESRRWPKLYKNWEFCLKSRIFSFFFSQMVRKLQKVYSGHLGLTWGQLGSLEVKFFKSSIFNKKNSELWPQMTLSWAWVTLVDSLKFSDHLTA